MAGRWRSAATRDETCTIAGAVLFSFVLGLASVALPLLAVAAGYSGVEIGIFTAISALAQLTTRLGLGYLMRVFPDWVLVTASAICMAASNAVVAVSAALWPFLLAQILQGVARACFWTGSQTHVVRGEKSSVQALATMNFVSSAGLLAGPLVAGVLSDQSPQLALAVGAVVALVGVLPTLFMDRLPPFSPPEDRPPGMLWRRPGVTAGCWAGVTAGAWRGLLGSYIPVALHEARLSSPVIGALVSVANAASVAGTGLVRRVKREWLVSCFVLGTILTGLATAVIAPLAPLPFAVGIALIVSGATAGVLQTLGPALASDAVHPEERGEAIAAAGTFRAAALFASPLAVAGMITTIPLSGAIALVGLLIALPAVEGQGLRRHLGPRGPQPRPGE